MRKLTLIAIVGLMIGLAPTCTAQDSLGVITVAGKLYDYWGTARDIEIHDNIAYIVTEDTGLRILDISEPDNPRELAYYYTRESRDYISIDIVDQLGFVLTDNDGVGEMYLLVFDLTDPQNPTIIATGNIDSRRAKIEVEGMFAYVAEESNGMRIFDISDPTEPLEISLTDYPDGRVNDLLIVDNTAFVAIDRFGIQMLDISDRENPTLIDTIVTNGDPECITVQENLLFVACNDLSIFNLENVDNIEPIGRFETPSSIRALTIEGNLAILKVNREGLFSIDISDPTNPREIGWIDAEQAVGSRSDKIMLEEGNLFSILGRNGLRVHDFQDPQNPNLVGTFNPPGPLIAVTVGGNYAYIKDRVAGLLVADISDPTQPREVGQAELPLDWEDGKMIINGNYLYVNNPDSGLYVFDISEPEQPEFIQLLDNLVGGSYPLLHGDLMLMSNDHRFLDIIDVSSPESPELISSCDIWLEPEGIAAIGNYVYVTEREEGILIVDISDPTFPWVVNFIPPFDSQPEYLIIDVENQIAACWDNQNAYLMDVSDPENPEFLSSVRAWWGQLRISNGHLITSNINGYLRTYDIRNPREPEQTGYLRTDLYTYDVDVQGFYLYAAHSRQFWIYDCLDVLSVDEGKRYAPDSNFVSLYPNPANSGATIIYRLSSPGNTGISIYDLKGSLVDQIMSNQYNPAGDYRIRWNTHGIPSGSYIIKIDGAVNSHHKTISVVK